MKFNDIVGAVIVTGGIVGVIALALKAHDKSATRQHELDIAQMHLYEAMSPEERERILTEKEKTAQAEAEARKSKAELDRIKITQDLINDPFTDSHKKP